MSTDMTSTVEEVAFGAANAARELASDPMGSARRQVKGLERKGTPTARKVNRQVTAQFKAATAPAKDVAKGLAQTAERIAGDLMPERVVVRGLQLVRVQAKRQDPMGDVAKRALKVFNGSFKTIARVATRLEHASALPVRHAAAPKKARTTRRTTSRRRAAA